MRRFGLVLICGLAGVIVGLAAPVLFRSWPTGVWPASARVYPHAGPIMARVRAVMASHEPYHVSETFTQYVGKNPLVSYEQADVAPAVHAELASYRFDNLSTGQVAVFGKYTWIKDDRTRGRWQRHAHSDVNCAAGFIEQLKSPLSIYLGFRHFVTVGTDTVHGVATWRVRGSLVQQGYRMTADLDIGQKDFRVYRAHMQALDSTGDPVVTDQEVLRYAGEQGRIRLPTGAKPGPSPSSTCTVLSDP